MQVKLLRVLQERQIRRVGENKTRAVNVRVLAATNRNLVDEIRAARFRQDLYYRLKVIEIVVPPLRERREDILPLARWFLAATSLRTNRKVSGFTPAAAHQLLRYAWPGNVREMENAVERAVVLARRSRIDVEDLPPEVGLAVPDALVSSDVRPLADVERDYIRSVLRAVGGNRTQGGGQARDRRGHVVPKAQTIRRRRVCLTAPFRGALLNSPPRPAPPRPPSSSSTGVSRGAERSKRSSSCLSSSSSAKSRRLSGGRIVRAVDELEPRGSVCHVVADPERPA